MYLVEHVFLAGDKFKENVKRKFRERLSNSVCPHRDTVGDLITKFVQSCGPGGSMRACHAAGSGSIRGRDRFPG